MATPRKQITGNTTSSLKDYSTDKRPNSQECLPLPRRQTGDQGRISKWPDGRRLALPDCACVATEDLPRIIFVSSGDELMQELSQALDPCPLEIRTLRSCLDAGHEIGKCATADIIFTDVRLLDGDWKHVLQMARQSPGRAEVIVVSRYADVPLYLDALEAGAFDFVVPPFRTVELGFIIVNAIYACFKQRPRSFSGNFRDMSAI